MTIQTYWHKIRNEVLVAQKTISRPLFLADGMPRSGSTLVYNYLRLCLTERYGPTVESGWIGDIKEFPSAEAYCVKAHGVSRLLYSRAKFSCYTYRDLRVALVSGLRKFGRKPNIATCQSFIRKDQLARKHATIVFKYEEILANKRVTIERLIDALEVNTTSSTIEEALSRQITLGISEGERQRDTQMHGGHATGTKDGDWRDVLDGEFLSELHDKYSWWFEANDYPIK